MMLTELFIDGTADLNFMVRHLKLTQPLRPSLTIEPSIADPDH